MPSANSSRYASSARHEILLGLRGMPRDAQRQRLVDVAIACRRARRRSCRWSRSAPFVSDVPAQASGFAGPGPLGCSACHCSRPASPSSVAKGVGRARGLRCVAGRAPARCGGAACCATRASASGVGLKETADRFRRSGGARHSKSAQSPTCPTRPTGLIRSSSACRTGGSGRP